MIMFKETDVLDPEFRKQVIKETQDSENHRRKLDHLKRYEIYHDQVAKYTEDLLGSQFDPSTVKEMRISLTNVSLCRKIIDKLARVYSCGVDRELPTQRDKKKIEFLEKHLKFNSKMKKANRYLELHNNIWAMCLPKPIKDAQGNAYEYDLKLSILPPFLFDVIEDSDDRESAKCLIISNFNPGNNLINYDAPERNGTRGRASRMNNFPSGDNIDQTIADTPMDYDPKNQKFTWWTDTFHFVTNQKGEIIGGPPDLLNPIGVIPGVALNKDQDGEYYSVGGADLVDSCLLTNAMLTNINHIGIQQGYGQAFVKGKNLPQQISLGPTKIVKLETDADNSPTEFGFATSNAPIQELKEITITQIALLLSTNNLSTSGVKVNLESGADFPSGVAMMIDKSESTEDVHDQAQLFIDEEPELWEVVQKWIDLYKGKGLLTEDLQDQQFDADNLVLKVYDPKPIMSEGEKLDNIQKRKDLGLNTMVELLKIDRPELSDTEAERILLQITEEKQKHMMEMQAMMGQVDVGPESGSEDNQKPNGKDKEMEMLDA